MSKQTAVFLLLLFNINFAQSNVNPDISLIGTFNTTTNFNEGSPYKGKINFEDPSLEMFINGYLNPYAKASANIAYHEGSFAAEEIYFEILRGLPLDMQLKGGKHLLGFGKINTVHGHAWPFTERPLAHRIYFGEEGLNDIGFNLSFILPTENFFSSFDIGLYKGDSFRGIGGHEHGQEEIHEDEIHEGEEAHEEFELNETNSPVISARLGAFFGLSDYSNLEIGLNGAAGTLGKAGLDNGLIKNVNFIYGGIDFKYKYKPDTYKSLTIQTEALLNHRDIINELEGAEHFVLGDAINTYGGFIFFDYQFNKVFSFGLKYDFTYGIIGSERGINSLANDAGNKTSGISGWFGYYPVEETLAIRIGAERLMFDYEDGTIRDDETMFKMQMIFSLGPHKAHPF
ncbi:MAG: hypothetical protein KJ571_08705 [Bacteroidetes bacterium]|nr:hypothetical protein [Bacteroidota bacterium]